MSIPISTVTIPGLQKKNEQAASSLKAIDTDFIEAVEKMNQEPTPGRCMMVIDRAAEKKIKLKVPPICDRYMKELEGIREEQSNCIGPGGTPVECKK